MWFDKGKSFVKDSWVWLDLDENIFLVLFTSSYFLRPTSYHYNQNFNKCIYMCVSDWRLQIQECDWKKRLIWRLIEVEEGSYFLSTINWGTCF